MSSSHSSGRVFLLNTPVVTSLGSYQHFKLPLDVVRTLLSDAKQVVSAVGHEATARLMTKILGYQVTVNRIAIEMEHGDVAIIFRVLTRLPEGAVLSEQELEQVPYEITVLQSVCRDCFSV